MHKITFTVDGQELQGTLFYPEKLKPKNPAILFLIGWKSEQKRHFDKAETLAKLGFICMTFDPRSHGESQGDRDSLTINDYLTDAITAYDYLKNLKEVDSEKIGVVGASFGGYLACLLSSKRIIKWLVLTAPANYFNKCLDLPKIDDDEKILLWREKKLAYKESISFEAVHNFTNDLLIVELELDTQVPHQTVENYRNAVKDPSKLTFKVIFGSNHWMREGDAKKVYLHILTDWFKDKI